MSKRHVYLDKLAIRTPLTILKLHKGGQQCDSNMNRVGGGSKNKI